jgi:Ca2+-binding RTX toxin-like protein
MSALEYSPSNILYGASRSKETSNSFTSSQLYIINPQTGAASSIADFPLDENSGSDIVFDPVNNGFLLAKSSDSSSSLFSVSLTGKSNKIGDIGFGGVVGLSCEGSTLVGFTGDNKRIIINPATGKGTFDRDITGLTDGYTISGAGSIPSATRTQGPTSPAPNPTPEKLPNTVTADFVDSDTDKILKNGIKNLIAINDTALLAVQLGSDLSGFNTSIRELDKLDDFKYGFWQEGIKDDQEKKTRKVEIRQLSESPKPENTWVLIHGWNDTSDRFPDLEKALKDAKPNDRVLLLDWSDASSNGTLPKDNGNSANATFRLGNYFAAKWATPVAEWAVKKLEQDYGIDGKAASENLKIIGHSLGSLVSSEMGRIYMLGKNRKGDNVLPNANGLNTLIALDPPSQLNIDLYSGYTASYDLDGTTAKADRPEFFQDVARNSLAFVGAKSIAGNQRLAAGALNSFQMDFGSDIKKIDEVTQEHFDVIKTFTELIKEKGEIGHRILNNETFNAKQNTFIYDDGDAQNGLAHEGVLFVEQRNQPTDLMVRNAKTSDKNDSIFYGTPKNDRVIGGLYKDIILADAGNDTLYGFTGDDTLYGQEDNDTIRAGKNNDILLGGEGDDFLFGDNDDDTLIGGKGKDNLTGGFGNDTFVFSSGDGASRIDDADIITDFGTVVNGFLSFFGVSGADKIGLAGDLKANMINFEPLNGNAQTALKVNVNGTNQYLAVLNGNFNKNNLQFQENFVIPTIY